MAGGEVFPFRASVRAHFQPADQFPCRSAKTRKPLACFAFCCKIMCIFERDVESFLQNILLSCEKRNKTKWLSCKPASRGGKYLLDQSGALLPDGRSVSTLRHSQARPSQATSVLYLLPPVEPLIRQDKGDRRHQANN